MYARIARYDVPPDSVEKAIEGFRDTGAALQELDGLVGGYLLVDQNSGRTVTLTLWDNHANMEGSATRAATLRQRALRDADGSVVSVEEFQIALEFGGQTRDVRE